MRVVVSAVFSSACARVLWMCVCVCGVSICGLKWVGLRVHVFGFSVQGKVSVWEKSGKAWSLRSDTLQ